MNRKEFIRTCGYSCLSFLSFPLIQACSPVKHVQGTVINGQLQILKSDFEIWKENQVSYRKSVICKPEGLDFPIIVYRISDKDYKALLLRCTHQNAELSVNGDIMTCSAHGSEFNKQGEV